MSLKFVAIHNLTRPQVQPVTAGYCRSFFCQLRGLMFRRSLKREDGLLLVQAAESRMESSIHMLFMRIDLTVVWINNAQQVVDVRLARRWRPAYFSQKPARYVLELHTDRLHDFEIGDQLHIEEVFVDR